jgi:hypothetical protein
MNWKRTLIISSSALLLAACSGSGAASRGGSPDYGQLLSTESGPTWNKSTLQEYVYDDVICNGLSGSETALALCAGNLANVENNPQFGDYNVGTQPYVAESVSAYKITYNTPGAAFMVAGGAAATQIVSGAVLIPNIAESQIKGVVLYYHGTIFDKQSVPSNFTSSDGLGYTETGAGVFGLNGYIVILPDYVGQGVNDDVMHPYVYFVPTNALSGLYMLPALRTLLKSHDITKNLSLYISSYSEGGAYALWASHLAQTSLSNVLARNHFSLRRTVGVSGAYNLTGKMMPYLYANAIPSWESTINTYNVSPGWFESGTFPLLGNIPNAEIYPDANMLSSVEMADTKLMLSGYALTAFIYYNQTPSAYNIVANPRWSNLDACLNFDEYLESPTTYPTTPCLINGQHYNLEQLFTTPGLSAESIEGVLANSASGVTNYFTGGMTYSQLTAAIESGYIPNNSVSVVTYPGVLQDPTIEPIMAQNNIYSWTSSSPLTIIYLHFDSVVTNLDSQDACGITQGDAPGVKQLSAPGMVDCEEIDNTKLYAGQSLGSSFIPQFLDHYNAGPLLQIAALHAIESGDSQ